MKNTLIICFSFLLSYNVLFAQYEPPKKLDIDFDIGMIAEMGILFLDKNTLHSSIIDDGTKDPQLKSAIHIYPVNLYLSGRLNFSDYIALEFRPGLFFAGDEYLGGELGFFVRYKFWRDKMFVVAGLNRHYNMGHSSTSFNSSDANFTFYGLNVGTNLSKSVALIISYYYQPKSKYLYTDRSSGYRIYTLKDILKLGFEITF